MSVSHFDESGFRSRMTRRVKLKRWFLHVLAVLGYGLGFPLWIRLFGSGKRLTVLLYHGISDGFQDDMSVPAAEFEKQVDFLKAGYSILSLSQAFQTLDSPDTSQERAVCLTFDDGYASNYTRAFPVLRARNLPATIFLIAGQSGAGHLGAKTLYEKELLNREQILEMAEKGISFGSHGVSHMRLKDFSGLDQVHEITESKKILENQLGRPMKFFSYPYGTREDFDRVAETAVKQAGYEYGISAIWGSNSPGTNRFALRRIGVEASDTLFTLRAKLNGALSLMNLFHAPWLRRLVRWVDNVIFHPGTSKPKSNPPVLLVSVDYPPHTDGVSTLSGEMVKRISKKGKNILVIGPRDEGDIAFDLKQSYRVTRVPGYHWGYFRFPPFFFQTLGTILSSGIRDVFVMNIAYGGVAVWCLSWFMKMNYVIFAYGYEFEKVKQNTLIRKFYLSIYARARSVMVCSRLVKERLTAFGVDEKKIEVLYPAVDLERFYPCEVTELFLEKYGLKKKRVLLTAGRLVERKGHDLVLKALPEVAAAFPDVLYCIVGQGEYEAALRKTTVDLGIENHVLFLGRLPEEELTGFYNCCELFVMPSRSIESSGHIEGFGIVYLEANACGKPVIGGNAGGVPEAILDGETGLLVDPASVSELSEKIQLLLRDPAYAARLGQQGFRRVREKFSWDDYAQKAYDGLLPSGRKAFKPAYEEALNQA